MSQSARVQSLEAIRDFKAALCQFVEDANQALISAELEVRRTFDWLDGQHKLWQQEIRQREQKVAQAQADLRRRRMSGVGDRPPDCTDQEIMLRKAKERLREAEDKLRATSRWKPVWQKAVDNYGGPSRQLRFMLDGELPQVIAVLDGKIDALDAYAQSAPNNL